MIVTSVTVAATILLFTIADLAIRLRAAGAALAEQKAVNERLLSHFNVRPAPRSALAAPALPSTPQIREKMAELRRLAARPTALDSPESEIPVGKPVPTDL